MDRKRKEIDIEKSGKKEKSNSQLPSSSNNSQAQKGPVMEEVGSTASIAIAESIRMEREERRKTEEATGEALEMDKDTSPTSKARLLVEMMGNARFGEATSESMMMEEKSPSTRGSSHYLMDDTVKMEKDESSSSSSYRAGNPSRVLTRMMEKATGKSMETEKALPSTCKGRRSPRFFIETLEMARLGEATGESMKTAASQYHSSKLMGNPKNGSTDALKCKTLFKPNPIRILPQSLQERLKLLDHIVFEKNYIPAEESEAPAPVQYEVCEICYDTKEKIDNFRNEGCRHSICTDCISKYIEVRVGLNSSLIRCPGLNCRVQLAPDRCREFLPESVADRWEKTIIETMIPDSEKFYCPFKDCSAMLLNDNREQMGVMTESECPYCRRLFCVQCHVPWHSEMECGEFQKLHANERGREDMQFQKLAEEKEWKRCPQCKFYVEKTVGCVHMTCRCGLQFCYRCGGTWSVNHGDCIVPGQRF